MKNSKFLFDFLDKDVKAVVVFVHNSEEEKLNSDIIYIADDNIHKIEKNKSETFFKTFMDCLKNKVSEKVISDIDIQADEIMKSYLVRTKDNNNICLISKNELENKYYSSFMKFIDEKRKKDYYVEFVKSLYLDNIKKININQSDTNCSIDTKNDIFNYKVSERVLEDEKEIDMIRNMINMMIKSNLDKTLKINSTNFADDEEKFNVSIVNNEDNEPIVNIKGVNLIKKLEYKGE